MCVILQLAASSPTFHSTANASLKDWLLALLFCARAARRALRERLCMMATGFAVAGAVDRGEHLIYVWPTGGSKKRRVHVAPAPPPNYLRIRRTVAVFTARAVVPPGAQRAGRGRTRHWHWHEHRHERRTTGTGTGTGTSTGTATGQAQRT